MSIFLRSTIEYDPFDEADASPQNLLAFSPDIIPFGTSDPGDGFLQQSYNDFVARALENGVSNRIWIRGRALDPNNTNLSATATLRAVLNELVLWPQVWTQAPSVGTASLKATSNAEVCVSPNPVLFQQNIPAADVNRHMTIIATLQATGKPAPVYPSAKNWRELVKNLTNDGSVSFYNVVVVDPLKTAWPITLKTRLRIFEDSGNDQKLELGIEVGSNSFKGVVCVVDANNNQKLKINTTDLGPAYFIAQSAKFEPGFDGFVTMVISKPDANYIVPNTASVTLFIQGDDPVDKDKMDIIGQEHIYFANSGGRIPEPLSFYFRTTLSDDATFPRTGYPCRSPDIQPWETKPDVKALTTLLDFTRDFSNEKGIGLTTSADNFVYLRGTFTTQSSGKVRLFAVPSSLLISPRTYATDPKITQATDAKGVQFPVCEAPGAAGGQVVVQYALELANLPSIQPVPNSSSEQDYCLIAEYLPDPTPENPNPQWPHDIAAQNMSNQSFVDWILSEPRIAWRNVSYQKNPKPSTWLLRTSFTLDNQLKFTAATEFTFKFHVQNVPVGTHLSMIVNPTSGKLNPPQNIHLDKTKIDISTGNLPTLVSFTGVDPALGLTFNVDISWYRGFVVPNDNQDITVSLNYTDGTIFGDRADQHILQRPSFAQGQGQPRVQAQLFAFDGHPHHPQILRSKKEQGRKMMGVMKPIEAFGKHVPSTSPGAGVGAGDLPRSGRKSGVVYDVPIGSTTFRYRKQDGGEEKEERKGPYAHGQLT